MQKPLIPVLLFAVLMFFGCGKSTDTPDNTDTWTVTYYVGPLDKDESTILFTGYTFEFNTNNELLIHLPDGTTKPAKYSLMNNDTQMAFGMENPFAPVDAFLGEWVVTSYTATNIKLVHDITMDNNLSEQGQKLEFTKQ